MQRQLDSDARVAPRPAWYIGGRNTCPLCLAGFLVGQEMVLCYVAPPPEREFETDPLPPPRWVHVICASRILQARELPALRLRE